MVRIYLLNFGLAKTSITIRAFSNEFDEIHTRDFALWQEVNKRKNAATFEMLIIIAGDAFAMAMILMLIVMHNGSHRISSKSHEASYIELNKAIYWFARVQFE